MIIPAYGLASAQPVASTFSLNFLSGALNAGVTFTRALATATRVNASGLIESVAADTARFNHNPITLARLGLLIEETRTNQVQYSQDMAQGYWTKTNTQVSAGTITAPDGTSTAQKLEEANTSNIFFLRRDFSVSAGSQSMSFFAKKSERSVVWATLDGGSNVSWFDLNAGTCQALGGTASIQAFPDGWYRCVHTAPTGTTSNMFVFLGTNATDAYVHTGVVGYGAYIWGLQLETSASFTTSYIPTSGATATRNADVAVMTGTNFSNWYNASKGTFRTDFISLANGNRPVIAVDDNSANESMIFRTQGTVPTFDVVDGGSSQASVTAGTVTENTAAFAYVSYDTNYFGIARPTARQVDTSGNVPTVDRLRIGADQAGNYANGVIQQIQFWR